MKALLFAAAAACLALLPPHAASADAPADDIDAALDLADSLPAAPRVPAIAPRPWKLDLEAAARARRSRSGVRSARSQFAADFQLDAEVAPSIRSRFAARYDRYDPLSSQTSEQAAPARGVPLVKEAYLGWQPTPRHALDVGRVNERLGAAFGYDPSDFFKAGAVDPEVSPDPESRRKNRLGSVMLRGQQLWDEGALSLLLSPRLAARREPGDPRATSDLQRTNGVDRWMLVGSHKLTPSLQPQALLYGERGRPVQAGLNLSTLFGDAVVGYAEWAGGRAASLIDQAAGRDPSRAFRSRAAAGATWTLPVDLSLTLEAQFNGAGATGAESRLLAAQNPAAWGRLQQGAVASQELPTRHGLFLFAAWRNFGMRRLDLSGFVQADRDDGGRQTWLELRRRCDGFDVAVQWQGQSGPAWSRFGAAAERRSAQIVITFYR